MNASLFEQLINKTEGETLDFKKQEYPLIPDKTGEETSKFIKDIISFSNTIRDESSYIILGIDASVFPPTKIGILPKIDESIYQAKIKDKVYPIPKFKFSLFNYEGLTFGVFEIPVTKYPEPVTVRDSQKKIESDTVYLRRGSSNQIAKPREIITINDWLRSLPSENNTNISVEISEVLSLISNRSNNFSLYIPRVLKLAKEIGNKRLERLARYELNGWDQFDNNDFSPNHRSISVYISLLKIEVVNYYGANKISQMWRDLAKHEDYYEHSLIFGDNINQLEHILEQYKLHGIEQLNTIKMSGEKLFPQSNLATSTFYVYWNYNIMNDLYTRIRQEFIRELTNLM